MKESALYIHIPFCDHKCIYCDFYSIIKYDGIKDYINAIKKEIDFFSPLLKDDHFFTSIFFGGGTPSFISPDEINELIVNANKHFKFSENSEITLETNPGTVNKQKLIEFKNAGVNRLSIGVQSFNDDELKFLTRIHNENEVYNTVDSAVSAGYDNISIDLIFNLPGQTKAVWISNLRKAVSLPINHISTYSLILEKGTILNKMVIDGKIKMQDDDYDADLYETTIEFLAENNFVQYEVSNFSKPGKECIHNLAYWNYRDYLGLGTSAHSFINNKRWWNFSSLNLYLSAIEDKGNAIIGEEMINGEKQIEEFVMLALRSNGLNLISFKNKFGVEWVNKRMCLFEDYKEKKYLVMENDLIRLTPKGYAVCDEIVKNIL